MMALGLTGSIGMGKSATAGIFRRLGVPVFDSDRCVHDLYEGPVADVLDAAFPGVKKQGRVDRNALAARILSDSAAMARLESLIHPLVVEKRREFLARMRGRGAWLVVLDIPLLFETGSEREVDAVVVVSAPAPVQRARVLDRPGMSEDKLSAILARQVPDATKRRCSHFIVQTDRGLLAAERQIRSILAALCPCDH